MTVAALAAGGLAGCGDQGGKTTATTPATRTSTSEQPTSIEMPTQTGPVETLDAGELLELPENTEWIEPTDEPIRYAMPTGWDALDMRRLTSGAPLEENVQRWAAERTIDLKKIVESDSKSGWSMRILRTDQYEPGPVAFLQSRWLRGSNVTTRKDAIGPLPKTARNIKVEVRKTPLGNAWLVTTEVPSGNRVMWIAKLIVNATDGNARLHVNATGPSERKLVVDLLSRTVSYR